MAIQLVTFGGLRALVNGAELDWLLSQHSRAALLVYLVVERRVSRESLTTIFWPESDEENARHALRQGLYQLRKAVGGEWIESRAHELVVTGDVSADTHDFDQALARGDAAAAMGWYRGPFLAGVHLVDLKPWESWVDARRAQYARGFRKACRELLESKRASGDLAGAIEAAEQWTVRDPSDDEAQHRLIEALAAAGERAEALRQYEAYARRLGPEGLEPLDETVALAERLRADPTPLPSLRAVSAPAPQPIPSDRSAPVSASRRPPRAKLGVAALFVVALAAVWGALVRREKPGAPPSATAIAVLPFTVRGENGVSYLGEGVVSLLGAALDGAGSLRPVDSRAIFAAVADAGDATLDPERGARIASRLGAPLFVLGDVVEAAGRLHVEAAVYEADLRAHARAVVSGPADSIFALVDRLAARLLGGLGDAAADRLLQSASLTTTSLSAFKTYLQAEGLMRDGQFERAAEAYVAALAYDSTFALAYYRLGLARQWAPLPGELEAADAAGRHGARLSARDRALLEAFREFRLGSVARAERGYRAILARYPEDVDAWLQLGELLFHFGPLHGRSLVESEEMWRKVLSYEPRNRYAVTHVARIAAADGRMSVLDSLLARFAPDELRMDRRLWEIMPLRAAASGDTATTRTLARDVRRWESLAVWRVAAWLTAFTPDPALTSPMIREMITDVTPAAERADLHWFASLLDLAGGRTSAARAERDEAVQAERAAGSGRRREAFGAVTEWFAATLPLPFPDSMLIRVRHEADSPRPEASFRNELGMGGQLRLEALRHYTLGIIALRLDDRATAAKAAAALERLAASRQATSLTRDLDRGLRAHTAWRDGRPEAALRLLESVESRDPQGDMAVIPFVSRAHERFLRGEVLIALGRDADALPWFASLGSGSVTEIPLRAPAALRQAEIHERLGDHRQAARHYERFLELWRDADPGFRHLTDSARQRLSGLPPPGPAPRATVP